MTHFSSSQLVELMQSKRYGVEFQPIISTTGGEIFAYECLSRFFNAQGQSIRPDFVYASLHSNPLNLFKVEYDQKRLQLAYAPIGTDIFVNLDQASYSASGIFDDENPFVQLFKNYKKANVVVELIENTQLSDAIMSLSMIDNLAKNSINTAIDDLFHPRSMVSLPVIQGVDYIKLDKYVIKNRASHNFMALVKALIGYAHTTGKQVVLEGVETESDLRFAKQIGVDYVQGFLYRQLFEKII